MSGLSAEEARARQKNVCLEGETCNFEDDLVMGERAVPMLTYLQSVAHSGGYGECYDAGTSILIQSDNPGNRVAGFKSALRCLQPCLDDKDAEFLTRCEGIGEEPVPLKSLCTTKKIEEGRRKGEFVGKKTVWIERCEDKTKRPPDWMNEKATPKKLIALKIGDFSKKVEDKEKCEEKYKCVGRAKASSFALEPEKACIEQTQNFSDVVKLLNPGIPLCNAPESAVPRTPGKIYPKNLSRKEKKRLLAEERKRLGLEEIPQYKKPSDIVTAIQNATNPKQEPNRLEVCFAVDASGSMGDDIQFIHNQMSEIASKWNSQYPDYETKIHVVEFSQESATKLELRENLKNVSSDKLTKYLKEFKTVGGIEPKFDAIVKCAQFMSDPSEDPPNIKVQREVIVLSDEPGDSLPGSPTPEQAAAQVKEKKATLTLIDPGETQETNVDFCENACGGENKTACIETKTTKNGHKWKLEVCHSSGAAVWKDEETGLLWSDRIEKFMNHSDAIKSCENPWFLNTKGGIQEKDKKWDLPSKEDFEKAAKNELREVLPNMKHRSFWSSSVQSLDPNHAYDFNGRDGNFYFDARNNAVYNSVRCVGRGR